jgi:hypothetical protein
MNISTIIQHKEIGAALFVLVVILFGAGYTTSEMTQPQAEEPEHFSQFAYTAKHDVNPMMQDVISNPTEYSLLVANNRLNIEFTNWAKRETGSDKDLFFEYLTACEKVVDDIQAGKDPDTSEMVELYDELNN